MHLVLEYGGSVWNPQGLILQEELNNAQHQAARFVKAYNKFENQIMTGFPDKLNSNLSRKTGETGR